MRNALLAVIAILFLLVLLASSAHRAAADPVPDPMSAPTIPEPPPFGKQVLEKVVDATNGFFATNVDRLTHDLIVLRVDADQRRANIGLGGGTADYHLRVASNVEIVDGTAEVSARLALAIGGRHLDVQLPKVEVAAASYRGERGVEVRLPLMRRAF